MIVENLAKYVKEKGVKQSVIADAVGMSPVAMSETLMGRRKLGAEEYVNICNFLEVPYDRFTDISK